MWGAAPPRTNGSPAGPVGPSKPASASDRERFGRLCDLVAGKSLRVNGEALEAGLIGRPGYVHHHYLAKIAYPAADRISDTNGVRNHPIAMFRSM